MSFPPVSGRPSGPRLRVLPGGGESSESGAEKDAAKHTESLNFEEVFRRYAPYAAAIGHRLLGRDEELDDLVQDVFIEVYKGLGSLREVLALKGWIGRITVRLATRRLKRRRLKRFLGLETEPSAERLVASGLSPEQATEFWSLCRKLDQLPASERVVWLLRNVEEQSLDDVAKLCGCSKSTVQRRLRSAQERLERRIDG